MDGDEYGTNCTCTVSPALASVLVQNRYENDPEYDFGSAPYPGFANIDVSSLAVGSRQFENSANVSDSAHAVAPHHVPPKRNPVPDWAW